MNKSRKLVRAICYATVTATAVATTVTNPYITRPYCVMAQVEQNRFNFENTTTVNISELPIEDTRIEYHISSDGNYKLTGSNYINEAYVDTTIIVDEGVKANIILDDLHIEITSVPPEIANVSGYCEPDESKAVSAFLIRGEANFYIQNDSKIIAPSNVLRINGKLNICESIGKAKLTFKTGDYSEYFGDVDSESGEVYIKGGNIEFLKDSNEWSAYMDPNFYIQGGNVLFSSNFYDYDFTYYRFENDLIIDGGIICGRDLENGEPINNVIDNGFDRLYEYGYDDKRNSQGYAMQNLTVTGLPANEKIVQINHRPVGVDSLTTGADGKLVGVCTKDCEPLVIYTSDQAYIYRYESGAFNTSAPVEVESYKLDFKLDEETIYSQWIGEGLAPEAPSSISHDYTFTDEAGNPYTEGTPITKGTEITVTATIKEYDVTVNGNPETAKHGQTLGEVLRSEDVLYEAADGSGEVYYCDYVVTEELDLKQVDTGSMTLSKHTDGKYYLNIADADDLNKFASLVNGKKLTGINGMLTRDISTTVSSFHTIGFRDPLTDDKTRGVNYEGTFDGQYHTITLSINTTDMAQGLFGAVADGAVIRNLVVEGSVSGGYASAGIVGMARGGKVTIENCINKADVTVTSGSDAAGILGTNLNNSTEVIIRNCGNGGNIEDTDTAGQYAAAISAWLGKNAKVENCYNTGSVTGVDTGDYTYGFARGDYNSGGVKLTNNYTNNEDAWIDDLNKASDDAFKSGEVCYKLNQGQEKTVWFQTCGEGYPILNGDPSTQTVYYGYADCASEEAIYSNSPLNETKGHNHVYLYDEGTKQITFSCSYCGEPTDINATVSVPDEYEAFIANGVTVSYSEAWESMPEDTVSRIKVKYAETVDGEYSEAIPQNDGTWFAGLFRADAEEPIATIQINVVKPIPTTPTRPSTPSTNPTPTVTDDNNTNDETGIGTNQIKEEVQTKEDGTKVVIKTEILENKDVVETVTETTEDGKVTTKKTVQHADGSKEEFMNYEKESGDKVEVTTITQANGSAVEQTRVQYKDGKTSLITNTQKDWNNKVIETTAEIEIIASVSRNKASISLSPEQLEQILEYMGSKDADVTINVVTKTGVICYKAVLNTKDIREKNLLRVYRYDTKTKKYIAAASGIKQKADKSLKISLPLLKENQSYQLVSEKTAKEINKKIFNDIRPDAANLKLSLKSPKKQKIKLAGITDSVEKVTYTSSNKNVKISKKGTLTPKKSGKATITVKVQLKNKATKQYKVKVTVK